MAIIKSNAVKNQIRKGGNIVRKVYRGDQMIYDIFHYELFPQENPEILDGSADQTHVRFRVKNNNNQTSVIRYSTDGSNPNLESNGITLDENEVSVLKEYSISPGALVTIKARADIVGQLSDTVQTTVEGFPIDAPTIGVVDGGSSAIAVEIQNTYDVPLNIYYFGEGTSLNNNDVEDTNLKLSIPPNSSSWAFVRGAILDSTVHFKGRYIRGLLNTPHATGEFPIVGTSFNDENYILVADISSSGSVRTFHRTDFTETGKITGIPSGKIQYMSRGFGLSSSNLAGQKGLMFFNHKDHKKYQQKENLDIYGSVFDHDNNVYVVKTQSQFVKYQAPEFNVIDTINHNGTHRLFFVRGTTNFTVGYSGSALTTLRNSDMTITSSFNITSGLSGTINILKGQFNFNHPLNFIVVIQVGSQLQSINYEINSSTGAVSEQVRYTLSFPTTSSFIDAHIESNSSNKNNINLRVLEDTGSGYRLSRYSNASGPSDSYTFSEGVPRGIVGTFHESFVSLGWPNKIMRFNNSNALQAESPTDVNGYVYLRIAGGTIGGM